MTKRTLASLGLAAIVVLFVVSGLHSTAHAHPMGSSELAARTASPAFQIYGTTGTLMEVGSPSEYAATGGSFFDVRNVPLQLLNVHYFIVPGKLVNGRYEYPVKVKAGKGIKLGRIELAYNDQTHTQLIAVGTPTLASAAVVDHLGGTPTSAVVPATSGTGDAPLHLIWHDPVNIWVAQVYDIVHWTYDGYQVDSITYLNQYEQWLWQDGWYEAYTPRHSSGIDYSGPRRYDAYADTGIEFINPAFCPLVAGGGVTFIAVDNNTAIGYYDGSREQSINTYDFGGCASWLNYFWQWG